MRLLTPIAGNDESRLPAAIGLFLVALSTAIAADFTVINNNDSGPGSLRQAVLDVNAANGGSITFASHVTGTIHLTSGEMVIARNLLITGPGADVLALNGSGLSRIFHVTNGITASINHLTITNGAATNVAAGFSGGAIWNDHSILVLRNCTIASNVASSGGGAIFNDGTYTNSASLYIEACNFVGNRCFSPGGAIYSSGFAGAGAVSVLTSTFHANTANSGGAIMSDGVQGSTSLSLATCTFTSNSATAPSFADGGAVWANGNQGNSTLFVSACTFSGNTAQTGGALHNSGVFGNAAVTIGSTIFQGSGPGGSISNNSANVVVSAGYNISDLPSAFLTHATDRTGVNPLLGPLTNNGGRTFTHTLLPGSPAIDTGKRTAIPHLAMINDQRGAPRPFDYAGLTNAPGGDGSDVGAFEVGNPRLALEQSGTNVVLTWPSYYADSILQTSTNLAQTNGWTTAPGLPVVAGASLRQTNGPVTGQRYFRAAR